jgi:hypothetical protein
MAAVKLVPYGWGQMRGGGGPSGAVEAVLRLVRRSVGSFARARAWRRCRALKDLSDARNPEDGLVKSG